MKFIDLQRQYAELKGGIDAAIQRVLDHGQYVLGPEVAQLEEQLASYCGVSHCITCANGTDSLMLALRALDIGPGDEVITVPFSFISSVETIRLVGATPVLVDILPDTFVIDPTLIEAAITPNTKAIMPVSLFGQMYDVEAVNAIAARHGLIVIEDGAQSFGAKRHKNMSCGATTLGSTSFFPAKVLGCYGDGGALFTNDESLDQILRALRNHGGIERYQHELIGTNSRLDTIQAAILIEKLKIFPEEVEARNRIALRYSNLLKEWVKVPPTAEGNRHVYAQYTVRCDERASVVESLQAQDIPFAIYYPKCLHLQDAYTDLGYGPGSFPVAEQVSTEVLSLPMHPRLTESEQDKVVAAVAAGCDVRARSIG